MTYFILVGVVGFLLLKLDLISRKISQVSAMLPVHGKVKLLKQVLPQGDCRYSG